MNNFNKLLIIFGLIQLLCVGNASAQWAQVGGGICDMGYAIASDGTNMFVGMNYSTGGGSCPNAEVINKWNGSAWSTIATSFDGTVYAMVVSGGYLYVGGEFTNISGTARAKIARYNISTGVWSSMGTGCNGDVFCLAADATGTNIYAGGRFTTAGGVAVNYVAAWNTTTSTWSSLTPAAGTPGVSGTGTVGVHAMTYVGGKLYIGGRFNQANGSTVNNVVSWTGSNWAALGSGITGTVPLGSWNVASPAYEVPVDAMTNDGSKVYIGGLFTTANGVAGHNNITSWDIASSTYSAMGLGMSVPPPSGQSANVYCLAVHNGYVVAGGDFTKAGTVTGIDCVARWDGSAWSDMSTSCGGGMTSDVFALGLHQGNLYAAGQFPPGPAGMYYIARYSGGGPAMSLSSNAPSNTICSGNSVTLTASGATTYSWVSNPAGFTSSSATPTVSPTTTTTYTVTGTTGGCSGSTSIQVTVNTSPTITGSNAAICQGDNTTLTAGGANTYSWSPATDLNVTTGASVVSTPSGTITYTVTGTAVNGCTGTKNITVTVTSPPTASISYAGPFCTSNSTAQSVTQTGTTGGTYTASPAGLSISAVTGAITPSSSSAGTYTVTYSIAASGGCPLYTTTASVTITAVPTASISYAGPFCSDNSSSQSVSQTGTAGGTYTSSPAGLSVNSLTGAIVPGTSTPNIYTVTYTIPSAGGCAAVTANAGVTITPLPAASISYAGPFCTNDGVQAVTQTGTTGGSYSASPAGLTINAGTGAVTPATSSAGTYTVTYSFVASGGCPAYSTTANVTITALPTASISYAGPFCTSTVAAQSVTQTGTAGGAYTASPAGLDIDAVTGAIVPATSTAGAYTVTYTIAAANGCGPVTATAAVTITAQPTVSVTPSSSICSGTSATLTASGAGSYSWSPATDLDATTGATVIASPSSIITYTVTGTVGVCSDTAMVTITVDATPSVSAGPPATICEGNSTTITATGATTYTWSPSTDLNVTSGDTVVASPSAPITYTVTGTTGNCSDTGIVTIQVNPTPIVGVSASNTDLCQGVGSTTLTGSGATIYYWTPSPLGGLSDTTGTSVVAVPPYTLTYTMYGVTGLCYDTAMITIRVHDAPALNVLGVMPANPTTCSGTDGQITGITAVGAPVIQYSWNGGPSQSSPDITGIPAGAYTLIATDGNGCRDTVGPYNLVDPNSPSAPAINPVGGSVCEGGVLTLSINGPAGGAIYSWIGPGGSLGNGVSVTVSNLTLADAGNYSVHATVAGCTGNDTTVSITVNPIPTAVITTAGGASVFCAGDSLSLSAASSTAPVPATITGYQWQSGGVDILGATNNTYTATTIGNYAVIVTNSNSCSDTSTTTAISVNPLPNIDITSAVFDSSDCNGSTGAITGISPTGPGNTYNWYNGSALISTSATSSDLTGQAAGNNYYLQVINANGCKDSIGPLTINNIAPPVPPVLSSGATVSYCQNDTINVITAASSLGGTINWYSDAGLTNIIAADTNAYLPSATPATYYVTETSSGCESAAATVTITINALPTVNANATQTVICAGGSTTLTGAGTAGVYIWDNSVVDGIGFSPATPLTYTVTGTDLLTGCSDTASIFINVNPTPVIDITSAVSDSSDCNGSTGAITGISPNVANNTYNWYNSSTLISTSTTTSDLTGQSAGINYYLEVIDQNGCKDTVGPLTINNIAAPAAPIVSANAVIYCQGSVINPLTAASSAGGTINWYSDAALTVIVAANTNTYTPPSVTATYYVTETISGCESVSSAVSVTINALPNVTANTSNANGVCAGSSVTLTGGGANLYTWNNGVVNGVSFIPAGTLTYIVTGTDTVTGCTDTASIIVNVHSLPVVDTLSAVISPASCGANVGGVSGVITSGQGPFVYQWSNGTNTVGTSPDLINVGAGTYTLTVTDANGCSSQITGFNINSTQGVIASFTTSSNIGATPFGVQFTNTSAGAVNYLWDFGNSDTSHAVNSEYTYDADGSYLVCLTADNGSGCLDTTCTTIEVYTDSYISIPNVFSPNDDGTNDLFYVKSKGLESLSGEIYDRWGLLMYELEGVNSSWDGRTISGSIATDGVYFYMIRAKGKDQKEYDKKGACTLIR